MPSIVGTWNLRVSWNLGPGAGHVHQAGNKIFKADGTWTYQNGVLGGRWVQVGDHVFFGLNDTAGLVYSANAQWASMTGIMGYTGGFNKGSFYALRLGIPGHPGWTGSQGGPGDGGVLESGGPPANNTDPMLGPVADPMLGSA